VADTYRSGGKVHQLRKTKKAAAAGKKKAKAKAHKKTLRSKVGRVLEATSLTKTGRRMSRKVGGNPEPERDDVARLRSGTKTHKIKRKK